MKSWKLKLIAHFVHLSGNDLQIELINLSMHLIFVENKYMKVKVQGSQNGPHIRLEEFKSLCANNLPTVKNEPFLLGRKDISRSKEPSESE